MRYKSDTVIKRTQLTSVFLKYRVGRTYYSFGIYVLSQKYSIALVAAR